eukprot:scaffold350_cov133-Cylindrotheca_fusiformis.AAC.11
MEASSLLSKPCRLSSDSGAEQTHAAVIFGNVVMFHIGVLNEEHGSGCAIMPRHWPFLADCVSAYFSHRSFW